MRPRIRVVAALAFVLVGAIAASPLSAGEEAWDGLSPPTRQGLVEALKAFLDPDIEFVWEPKRTLEAQLDLVREEGIRPLADVGFLRRMVYEGRRFKARFEDKEYRDAEGVTEWTRTQGVYDNFRSEKLHVAYAEPKRYPSESRLERQRPEPFPLLMAFHEKRDLLDEHGRNEPYPGAAALSRLYPRREFGRLYQDWFLVAPIAPRGRFLNDDGTVDHRFSTTVLRTFLQRYHIDFQRIVLDGRLQAATLASIYAPIFSGLVLRGGDVPDEMVTDLETIPIFVVGDDDLARRLEDAGHPDVTLGGEADLQGWLLARKKETPKALSWRVLSGEHRFAYWIYVGTADVGPSCGMDVRVLDTADDPNTIRIDSRGIEKVSLFLNDDVVDLDRDVRLVWNGRARMLGRLPRTLRDLFENKITDVRKSMIFAWLYPAFAGDLPFEGGATVAPGEEPAGPSDETAKPPSPPAADWHLNAEYAWLFGRPDLLETLLPFRPSDLAPAVASPQPSIAPADVWPYLLRDLWWRPADEATQWARKQVLAWALQGVEDQGPPALEAPYRWLRDGGDGPYPAPPMDEDPWPVLSTLVLDRQKRQATGAAGYPDASPILQRPPPDAWAPWWHDWLEGFGASTLKRAYQGDDRRTWPPEERAPEEALDREARRDRTRNALLAAGAVLVLLLGGGLLARRSRPRPPSKTT